MNFDFSQVKKSLTDVHNFLKQEYLQISTGRANPGFLDGVMVSSYGSLQPVKNIASINLEDARTMKVSPWDKGQIKDIEKAIVESNLPFSVSVDDSGVRVHVPQMTEESKTKIVKLVREKLEAGRVKVRTIRHDAIRSIEAGDYSDDAEENFKDELEKTISSANKSLEELCATKEADIMSV
ncbi:ribosome recycling factor [Patescibacteria group bacterium]|nr:ribosome recycling factor [Patescibacteria group bacterium]